MVPSTLRLAALAAIALAVAALFAFPTVRQGAAGDRVEARPAAAPSLGADAPTTRLSATSTPIRELEPVPAETQRITARVVAAAKPKPKPQPRATYRTALLRDGRTIKLRATPGGPAVARLSSHTEFGTRRPLAVAEVRGRWLGVLVPERPNGKLGWIDGSSRAIRHGHTKVSLRADLSERRVDLRVGGKVVKRLKVAIGRPGSSTPTGRFAITDKLSGGRFGPYYGCCILAMSGHQPNLPAGWRGGNRLAVHGTNSPGTIGMAASAGCLRAADRDLRTLMRRVPVATQILVRR